MEWKGNRIRCTGYGVAGHWLHGILGSYESIFFSITFANNHLPTEDGKEMRLDAEKLGIKGVVEEVDRHSRILSRQAELTGN